INIINHTRRNSLLNERKISALITSLILICSVFGASGRAQAAGKHDLRVLATFLPVYVFTKNVTAGVPGVKVDILIGTAVGCPHDYQLKPGEVKKIVSADVLVANGRIEEFLGAAVKKINPGIRILISGKDIKPIRGLDEVENPHTWVSLSNAVKQVEAIRGFMVSIDPANKEKYNANAVRYEKELSALRDTMKKEIAGFPNRKIVTFHDVFDYFAKDVGLEVVAYVEAVPGQEPSAGEIAKLMKKIKKSGAAAVYSEPQYPSRVVDMISRDTGRPYAELDPMAQTNLSNPPLDLFQSVMRKNLNTLKRTLGK
ncbi:MAG TPA: metal ABC transporter substrate-binding protein, partial [bacterium]|nr:metal ABC transporter substrate-binding protein [bacterium]